MRVNYLFALSGFCWIPDGLVNGALFQGSCPAEFRCERTSSGSDVTRDGLVGGLLSELRSLLSPKDLWMIQRENSSGECESICVARPGLRRLAGQWECGACPPDFPTQGPMSVVPTFQPNTVPTTMPIEMPTAAPNSATSLQVFPSDVKLVAPPLNGPIVSSITAYNWRSDQTWPDANFELPIYNTLDRDTPDFWTYLVDELLLSRQHLILLHGRGCYDKDPGNGRNSTTGLGSMCPRLLVDFVQAVQRAGVEDVIKVGMWDDTGMYRTARNRILGTNDEQFDIANEDNWQFFWDYNIKIWFETVPSNLWYRINGKPVIANWHLRSSRFSNQQGNASRLLIWLKQQFMAAHGVEPYFLLHYIWFDVDTTITTAEADGMHGWFNPPTESYTYATYNGDKFGVVLPSFRDSRTIPGCGEPCREIVRNEGATLRDALAAGSDAKLIMIEGWTNMIETAGLYRSKDWEYPTQNINIVRQIADPEPETLLFQAEGADSFEDWTPENIGGAYSDRALDVGALKDETGWYVGWTEVDEWLEYRKVLLGCGWYRFTAKAATTSSTTSGQIRLALGNMSSVVVPPTASADDYTLIHLGSTHLASAGDVDLRLYFESSGVNLDWFFCKRISTSCT